MELVHRSRGTASLVFRRDRRLVFQKVCYNVLTFLGLYSYFNSRDYPDPAHTTQLALTRATGPSLGTTCLSSLLLTLCQSMNYLLRFIRYVRPLRSSLMHNSDSEMYADNHSSFHACLPSSYQHSNLHPPELDRLPLSLCLDLCGFDRRPIPQFCATQQSHHVHQTARCRSQTL